MSVIGFGVFSFLNHKDKSSNKKEKKDNVVMEKKSLLKKEVVKEEYKVDIKGEVNLPGIYSLEKDKRVVDVIELAGGLTENADTSVINLSKKIMDEMVIIIYSREEVMDFKKTKEVEVQVQEKCNQKDENSLVNNACITSDTSTTISGKVSINTASVEEFMTLPGIGEKKAKDIVEYRDKNGPFTSIEDLTKVSGIGENTLAEIKENITLE